MKTIGANEVHVWRAKCGSWQDARRVERYLNSEERRRAESFRFAADRIRYRVGRGALRSVLSRYTSREATAFEFASGEHGKPYLRDGGPRFNLAHSGEWVLIALAAEFPVGVDVEQLNRKTDFAALVNRICADRERRHLLSLEESRARVEFFVCWTRKEALLKAMGTGLSVSPADFDVGENRAGDWEIRSLDVAPGYCGAVAGRAHGWQLLQLDFDALWRRSGGDE